ncbi:Pre-rRNA-processing protein pno1 [Hondaea fermentalgiana]|uniref:Pre-rRNA-processing protein pno1 n=1 Tax=Hondaea fermentalgiana TaxID=2315210 RepID=A0A2R5GT26_9STRA|nr:Pre-rRNA-processing protein pno1 [Hondaea fermentalgiana]|eukprot:GBG33469.1 Pre-rRNA-processing protein pno1 [Hondaea fermentalgiana]
MEIDSGLIAQESMAQEALAASAAGNVSNNNNSNNNELGPGNRIKFAPLTAEQVAGGETQYRRVRIPPHRYTPLQKQWENILTPLVQHMKLHVRFNPKSRSVEMKTSPETDDPGALARAADFVQAFAMGFDVQDAVALLRLEDLFVDSFEVKDVKMLHGDHLSRAIGRIAGQGGKTKYAIENATRTRIVVADQRIHILGSFQNIKIARDAICKLILGAPPGKVYNQMRTVASRMNERF